MKKIILLFSLIFIFTGCSSYTELNELNIVDTLGIDYVDNKYYLFMNVVDGSLENDEIEEKFITYQTNGDTLEECFHKIYLQSPKRLYLSHIDLLILTDDAINNKFKDIINNFLKNNEYRNNFSVVLLKDIDLDAFMKKQIPAKNVNNLIKTNHKETGITKQQDLESMMKELLIDNNTYLPTIQFINDEVVIDGFTLIKNYHVFEQLSELESIIFNLLQNEITKTYIKNNNILENQTIITTKKNNITFRLVTTIMEDNDFKKVLKDDILAFLYKYQNKDYDILKLCEKIRRNDYNYYKKTYDLLPKLTYNIIFNTTEKENYLQGDFNEK